VDAPRAAISEREDARQPEAGFPAVQAVAPMRRLAAEWMGVSVRGVAPSTPATIRFETVSRPVRAPID
jgi:hypothetical protein